MNPCLVILNPRQISDVAAALDHVDMPKCWLTSYSESRLREAFPAAVEASEYTHYIAVSDDVVVNQEAVDAVIGTVRRMGGPACVTGFCNVDENSHAHLVNLTHQPLPSEKPSVDAYSFRTSDEVAHARSPFVRSWFAGMTLTCLPRRLWVEFPFGAYRGMRGKFFGSDYHLSWRLQQANIPVVAPRNGLCHHLKAEWNQPDERWPLFEADQETRWER